MPLIASAPQNRIILGLMTFGPDESKGARITDVNEFNRCLDTFQARGYNEVDTARVYIDGQQEAFTKQTNWKERGLTLATKFKYPAQAGGYQAAKVVESLETSLKELGTDCVDVSLCPTSILRHVCLPPYTDELVDYLPPRSRPSDTIRGDSRSGR